MAQVECICRYCKKPFIAKSANARVCQDPECRRKYNTENMRKKRKSRSERQKEYEETWRDIILGAEQSGLSYGQYVARRNK